MKRIYSALIGMTFFAAPLLAQESGEVSRETITFDHGGVYEGEIVDGRQHGFGIYTQTNGYRYEGNWRDGQINGQGLAEFPDGARYKGQFRNGQPEGRGQMTLADGSVLTGNWVNGNLTGYAHASYTNGIIYEGDFVAGEFHGIGRLIHPNGYTYHGTWENGRKEGTATITFPDGSVYQGHVAKGVAQGRGQLTDADGGVFDGWFQRGAPNGPGVFTFPPNAGLTIDEMTGIWAEGQLTEALPRQEVMTRLQNASQIAQGREIADIANDAGPVMAENNQNTREDGRRQDAEAAPDTPAEQSADEAVSVEEDTSELGSDAESIVEILPPPREDVLDIASE